MRPALSIAMALLSAVLPGACVAASAPAQAPWSWVRLQPAAQGAGWDVRQGRAVLTTDPGGRFHTELDIDGPQLRQHYRLEGVMGRGRVEATETLLNSDASPLRYFGEAEPARPGRPACLHLHSGRFALHLCQDSPS